MPLSNAENVNAKNNNKKANDPNIQQGQFNKFLYKAQHSLWKQGI